MNCAEKLLEPTIFFNLYTYILMSHKMLVKLHSINDQNYHDHPGFHLIELNALLQVEQKTVCNLISLLQDPADLVLY